jgi:hypothetical protein
VPTCDAPNPHPPASAGAAAEGTHRLVAVSHAKPVAHAVESVHVSMQREPSQRYGEQSFALPSGLFTV